LRHTFHKSERLCNKVIINKLFSNGHRFTNIPFKVYWQKKTKEECPEIRVLIIVPKRLYKKSVDRNRLKRQIKEVYRLQKHILYDYFNNKEENIDIAFVYIAAESISFKDIENKIISIFNRLIKNYE
jgi:ribonuclease P protein component